jgi:hypothetical protein
MNPEDFSCVGIKAENLVHLCRFVTHA